MIKSDETTHPKTVVNGRFIVEGERGKIVREWIVNVNALVVGDPNPSLRVFSQASDGGTLEGIFNFNVGQINLEFAAIKTV